MGEDKLRVLVVDDEKSVRDFFKRLLSLLNLDVCDVEDGYKAIELAKKERFDLFFIDVRMPGLDGLETYREIRKLDPNATVVMITGYAVEDMLEQARKEGVYNSIHKPFDINQIKEVIDKAGKEKIKEPLNILVIDNEQTILDFFSALLKERNLRYKVARNKDEALAAAKKEKFDLVFLDIVFKDTNGLEVYKEIKTVLPQTSVVLITGYPQEAEKIKGKIEIAGCLYKPFDIESIIDCIQKIKARVNA